MMRAMLLLVNLCLIFALTAARPRPQPMSVSSTVSLRQAADAAIFTNFNQLNRRQRRRNRRPRVRRQCRGKEIRRYRTLSGFCNNLRFPNRGAAETPFIIISGPLRRRFEARGLPNARRISNIVHDEAKPKKNKRGLAELLTFFGQFIDHTLTETETDSNRPFRIRVPKNDPVFKESQFIPFFRTKKKNRAPVNLLSSYIDADAVYGVDEKTTNELRELVGGRMKAPGGLLPRGPKGQFLAGDRRVNENPNLQAMHLLWVLEHNKVAAEVAKAFKHYTDEEIFKLTRHIVAAELQAVTWHEFLPALTGRKLPPYRGYRQGVKVRISNRFSTVGFRVGHTLLNKTLSAVSKDGIWKKFLLRDVFFNPDVLTHQGIGNMFRGMTRGFAAEVDAGVTGEVRNFLIPRQNAIEQLDLAALNIQRGRDHGVPSCNDLRETLGLRRFYHFHQVTRDYNMARKLHTAYRGRIDDMDAWTCGVAEKHVRGSSLGRLFQRILRREFRRLRDGDRFYFERVGYFTPLQRRKIPTVRKLVGPTNQLGSIMRTIIARNTDIPYYELNRNPFFV